MKKSRCVNKLKYWRKSEETNKSPGMITEMQKGQVYEMTGFLRVCKIMWMQVYPNFERPLYPDLIYKEWNN